MASTEFDVGQALGADVAFDRRDVGPAWRGLWDDLELAVYPSLSVFSSSGSNTGITVSATKDGPLVTSSTRGLDIVSAPGGRAFEGQYRTATDSSFRTTTIDLSTSSKPGFPLWLTNPEITCMNVMQKIGSTFGSGTAGAVSQCASQNAGDIRWHENGTTNRLRFGVANGSSFVYAEPTLSEDEVRGGPRAYVGMQRTRRARMYWRYGSAVSASDQDRGTSDAPGSMQTVALGSYSNLVGFSAGSTDWWHYLAAYWNRAMTDSEAARLIDNPYGPFTRTRRVFALTSTYSYLYPVSDVADGGWLNELATATNLYASVDEVAVDDADYVIAPLTASADTVKFGLASAGGTPGAGTVSLIIRHKKV